MATSQNGWPVHTSSSSLKVLPWITGRVLPGDVYTIFDYLCRRFDAEVEPITVAHSWGWAYRPIRGSSDTSNHASATAIDLNAPAHPLGAVNTFTSAQRTALRAILRDLGDVVRWGGDYAGRKDEMHLEINASAAALATVARSLTQTSTPQEDDMDKHQDRKLDETHAATTAKVRDGDRWLEPHDADRVEIALLRRNEGLLRRVLATVLATQPVKVDADAARMIAEAIPDDIAQDVADVLAARLAK